MDTRGLAFYLVLAGALLMLLGFLAHVGVLGWFGRLPGDIRIERVSTRIYIPLTSMILLSIVISMLLALLRRFL